MGARLNIGFFFFVFIVGLSLVFVCAMAYDTIFLLKYKRSLVPDAG